jgi:diguanylate cyclase (GGDEF)-like protein
MPDSRLISVIGSVVDRVDIGICILNLDRQIVYWNHFLEANSGRPASAVLHTRIFDSFPELGSWLDRKIESAVILGHPLFSSWEQRPYIFRFASRRSVVGGLDYMAQNCTFMPLRDPDNDLVSEICLVIQDATDTCIYQRKLQAALMQVKEMATHDELTGLFNRRQIESLYRVEFARCKRYQSPLSVLMADVDYFKKVNDQYGHLGGDAVLRVVAQRLGGSLRTTDVIGRYGGEELMVLFPVTEIDGAQIGAERLRKSVEESPVEFEGKMIPVTISIGVAQVHESHGRPEDALTAADEALYESKRGGRNRVTCARP